MSDVPAPLSAKDRLDVSKVFLCYLHAGGDPLKTATAAGCKTSEVLFLERAENWPEKLSGNYSFAGGGSEEQLARAREMNRVSCVVQAQRLSGAIDRVLQFIYDNEDNIEKFCKETVDKKGMRVFSVKPLLDLTKAAQVAQDMMFKALDDKGTDGDDPKSGNLRDVHLTIVNALSGEQGNVSRAMRTVEVELGTDVAKKSIGMSLDDALDV